MAFECGERSVFFELWDRHVSTELRGGDPTCQSLEFSASVYFAVYPSRMGVRKGGGWREEGREGEREEGREGGWEGGWVIKGRRE